MIEIPMKVSTENVSIPVKVYSNNEYANLNIGAAYHMGGGSPYKGPYEFTPSRDTQIAQTAGKLAGKNIVINPIPSNYGLITYNGSYITVS